MKILDVLSITIPNAYKDKNPKKVAYKKGKSPYGANGAPSSTDGSGATGGASSGGPDGGGAGGGGGE
jgi:hypothetical protein